jgi:tetratricopeptide (TPR) repeat protein
MTARGSIAWLAALAACGGLPARDAPPRVTTDGDIALANLDHLIAQHGDEPGAEDLLLARSRFLADYDALDRAVALAEARCPAGQCATVADLLRRGRARSAAHRFADALEDLAAAEAAGSPVAELATARAAILVATGRAGEAIVALEAAVAQRADLASLSALATARAAAGQFVDADRLYAAALDTLDTTSPFPFAWLEFARGVMWAEQAGDPARADPRYRRALVYLPAFAAARIHLAEIDAAHGDRAAAALRLAPVAAAGEPEALGLLGALHLRDGDAARGRDEIARAAARFESLLARQRLAFADHAAEFYLGPGADPERAWTLAQDNLAVRPTERAYALALAAARATGRTSEAEALRHLRDAIAAAR